MYQKLYSCSIHGLDSYLTEIEVNVTNGIPYFTLLGMSDNIARSTRERLRSALQSCGFPLSPHKITVNCISDSQTPIREGLDLPITIGILCAQHLLPSHKCTDHGIIGNMTLNGEIRPVHGILNMIICCRDHGLSSVLIPSENAKEAALIPGIRIIPVHTLEETLDYWRDRISISPVPVQTLTYETPDPQALHYIRGQLLGKRALEIAAAGYHNLLFCGPPGCGKTLLLQALSSLLPPPSDLEIPDLLRIRSVFENTDHSTFTRPLRQPHHSLSTHALIGGGNPIRPGEMTRAHGGILLLDEIAEFSRPVLENLRQPLESHKIQLHYLDDTRCFPADFLLAASMNLCPCGQYPDPNRCTCHPHAIRRYQNKLGTPLIERFDLCLILEPVSETDTHLLTMDDISEIRSRILNASLLQQKRYRDSEFIHNSRIPPDLLDTYCILTPEADSCLRTASIRLHLSMRQQHNLKKVARTIADLSSHTHIEIADIMEALQYRPRSFLSSESS